MISKKLLEKFSKLYPNDQIITILLKREDYNNLYLYLFNQYEKIKSIPNEIILHYLRKKDFECNLDFKLDVDKLYNLAKENKEKIDLFLEYEKFFNDSENFV